MISSQSCRVWAVTEATARGRQAAAFRQGMMIETAGAGEAARDNCPGCVPGAFDTRGGTG